MKKKMVEELIALANIRSESGYESRILSYLCEKLDNMGLPYEKMPVDEERYNIIVNPEEKYMLNAHVDTVGDYFPPEVEDNIIWGRGVLDDKAGVVILLELLEKYGENMPTVVFFVDEEEKGRGSEVYTERYAHDFAITLEPTGLRVCTAEAGSMELEFEFWGRATHGSCAREEDNAIWQGIKFLSRLREMSFLKKEHRMLGKPEINIEMIEGGDYLLAVPGSAKALVDFIYLPKQNAVSIIEEVNGIEKDFNAKHMIYDISPPFEISPARKQVRAMLEFASIGGFRSWSDAQNLVDAGTPSVVFGPGELKYAHTADEHVSVDDVIQAYRILEKTLKKWKHL